MAKVPSINRMVHILPAGKEGKAQQTWVPLITAAGCLVSTTRRCLVADVLADLMDAHLASNLLATFGAVGHGIRAVNDARSGMGAPFFIEARGASVGEVLLFNVQNRDALRVQLGDACTAMKVAGESKGPNTYVTLAKGADASKVYSLFAVHASNRANVGWTDLGGPAALDMPEAVNSDAAPAAQDISDAKVSTPSKRSLKRAAKAAKGATEAETIAAKAADAL